MTFEKHKLWSEKYRPTSLSSYVFHDNKHQVKFEEMVSNKDIPNLLLSGVQGSGKTTLSQILMNELGIDPMDVLTIHASDENSVDIMRDKIKNFIMTAPLFSHIKVVQLEEADYMSLASQSVLRKFMEEDFVVSTRFILTCNYENKLIPAIKSRCQHYRFAAPNKDFVTEYVANVLIQERVKFDITSLDACVAAGYPDIRKIINILQQNTISGVLSYDPNSSSTSDYKLELFELLNNSQWIKVRELVCGNVLPEEWEDLYKFLYSNIHLTQPFKDKNKWESAIIIIAEHLYKHAIVADPEINAAAMFIRLSSL